MTIAVIGKTGQLARGLKALGGKSVHCFDRSDLDLSKPNAGLFIRDLPESITGVILAAAYTNVDGAQSEPELAQRVNAEATCEIAKACAQRGLPLVYVSTDYVFDGRKAAPYAETDIPNPINIYGQSKLGGERAVLDSEAKACILRTSWVYDWTGKNFFTTMLRLGETFKPSQPPLRIVGDQWGRPTLAQDLARAAFRVMEALIDDKKIEPIYHVSNLGEPVSWAGFARFIFETAELTPDISSVSSEAYGAAAQRPKNSVLDTSLFDRDFGPLPLWTDSAYAAIKSL